MLLFSFSSVVSIHLIFSNKIIISLHFYLMMYDDSHINLHNIQPSLPSFNTFKQLIGFHISFFITFGDNKYFSCLPEYFDVYKKRLKNSYVSCLSYIISQTVCLVTLLAQLKKVVIYTFLSNGIHLIRVGHNSSYSI